MVPSFSKAPQSQAGSGHEMKICFWIQAARSAGLWHATLRALGHHYAQRKPLHSLVHPSKSPVRNQNKWLFQPRQARLHSSIPLGLCSSRLQPVIKSKWSPACQSQNLPTRCAVDNPAACSAERQAEGQNCKSSRNAAFLQIFCVE